MKIEYAFVNGEHSEVEVSEELGAYILNSRREESNNNRRYRRHYLSLEESMDIGHVYSYDEEAFDYNRLMDSFSVLTEVERKRLSLLIAGYTVREIAELDGYGSAKSAVHQSITRARAKIKAYLEEN